MDRMKIMIVLTLVLTTKTIAGQPKNCICHTYSISNGTSHYTNCNTRGCSVGTNPVCDRYYFIDLNCCDGGLYGVYHGCNCPNSLYNGNHNGAYGRPFGTSNYNYNYTTCTDYGLNARDDSGSIPYGSNVATDCCNYCCDRDDPYSTSTSTSTTTTTMTITTPTTTELTTTSTVSTTIETTLLSTTTHTTISTATGGSRAIIIDKLFHVSVLIILVLMTSNSF